MVAFHDKLLRNFCKFEFFAYTYCCFHRLFTTQDHLTNISGKENSLSPNLVTVDQLKDKLMNFKV